MVIGMMGLALDGIKEGLPLGGGGNGTVNGQPKQWGGRWMAVGVDPHWMAMPGELHHT